MRRRSNCRSGHACSGVDDADPDPHRPPSLAGFDPEEDVSWTAFLLCSPTWLKLHCKLRKKEGAGHPVSGVVPFCVGWRPVVHGTPTLTEWPMPFFVFPDSGVVPFCVGWRPVAYGTPTLTE